MQQANYSQQTGSLADGTLGFAWHEVIVARRGSTVDWAIDGIRLATITNATFTASNIFVGYWDPYASLTDNTNLSFGLVDNVRVEVPVTAPTITTQPQNQTVVQGSNAAFSVTANGTAPLSYQWRFNGTNLAVASASACTVTNAQSANAGTYTVVVANSGGSVTSAAATLTVNVPPLITAQPQGQTNLAGITVTLSVTASGTAPLCYRWQCAGTTYPPGTNTFLTSQAGGYSVIVSNVAGLATSAVASVVFTNLPAQPGCFDSICRLTNGAIQLSMTGTAGTNYILQCTSDWVVWSNLCTLSATNGVFMWVDPCATNGGHRFYRLRLN